VRSPQNEADAVKLLKETAGDRPTIALDMDGLPPGCDAVVAHRDGLNYRRVRQYDAQRDEFVTRLDSLVQDVHTVPTQV